MITQLCLWPKISLKLRHDTLQLRQDVTQIATGTVVYLSSHFHVCIYVLCAYLFLFKLRFSNISCRLSRIKALGLCSLYKKTENKQSILLLLLLLLDLWESGRRKS